VETFHYEKQDGTLLQALAARLIQAGVVMNPLPPEAVLETLREFGAITKFSIILKDMLGLLRSVNPSEAERLELIKTSANPDQVAAAFELLAPIAQAYEQELQREGRVDFDDMINRANSYVIGGSFQSPWRFIVVDEFQDIAKSRADLVKALRKRQLDVSLFCVGDDWQSIYRFTGSDISFTADFENHFGPTMISGLDKTFRFNSKIGEVASRFVMKNRRQLTKDIQSHTVVTEPTVSLIRASLSRRDSTVDVITRIVSRIGEIAAQGSSVYFLARFKHDLPDLADLCRSFPNLTFQRDSIHSAKGKEADYVVLLGLGKGKFGLPSEIATHPLVEALLPKLEGFPHAEERRLFYVALTRAKHRVYLVSDMTKCSAFVQELVADQYPIETDEFQDTPDQLNANTTQCPACTEGQLVKRVNATNGGLFSGCTNYPRCRHTESSCDWCSAAMKRSGRFRICVSRTCKRWIPVCPHTGGEMSFRSKAKIWGCSHYRGSEAGSCRHIEKDITAPPEKAKLYS
jgi:DNA helicase-4